MHSRSCICTHIVQSDQRRGPAPSVITDGVENAILPDSWQELLNEESKEYSTDRCQEQIVHHKYPVEFEWFPFLHEFSSCENSHVIGCEHRGTRSEG